MTRVLTLALAVACLTASGCAFSTARWSSDRTTFQQLPLSDLDRGAKRCPYRLCVDETMSRGSQPGPVQLVLLNALTAHFDAVSMVPGPRPEHCDVALKFDSIMSGDKADLRSVHTGEFLARLQTPFHHMGHLTCRLISAGGALAARVPESAAAPYRRAAAPVAAAPAPSAPTPGLSAADIERIAKAVRGAEPAPAAPAGSAPPLQRPRYTQAERPDDLAVVVGVETYSDIATKAPYAERDAEAFKAHVRALGVPERNIVLLTGSKAVRSALVKNVEGWLPRMAKPGSRVYFYFSGHGAPDVKSGQAYLVPWDGDPNFLDATAYPVAQLYKKLGELPVKQVIVAMDSCFSGAGGRSVLASGARPLVAKVETGSVPSKLTVLAASASDEISGSLDARGHGAFTWFLLEGLDAGKTTAKALHEYLTPKVQDEARRLNRDQTPQLLGADAVLR